MIKVIFIITFGLYSTHINQSITKSGAELRVADIYVPDYYRELRSKMRALAETRDNLHLEEQRQGLRPPCAPNRDKEIATELWTTIRTPDRLRSEEQRVLFEEFTTVWFERIVVENNRYVVAIGREEWKEKQKLPEALYDMIVREFEDANRTIDNLKKTDPITYEMSDLHQVWLHSLKDFRRAILYYETR